MSKTAAALRPDVAPSVLGPRQDDPAIESVRRPAEPTARFGPPPNDLPAQPGTRPEVPPAELDPHTRNRLLCAAVHVFDRKGYAAASVREIVELAGVTKPALYYHFGSKEQLLVAILNEAAREFGDVMRRAVEHQGSTRERLLYYAETVHAMFSQNVPLIRVAHAMFVGPSEAAPTFDFTLFDRHAKEAIGSIVADGLAIGEVREAVADDVALAVSGVVEACIGRQLHPGIEPLGFDRLRRILELVFDGVLTEPRAQGVHIS